MICAPEEPARSCVTVDRFAEILSPARNHICDKREFCAAVVDGIKVHWWLPYS